MSDVERKTKDENFSQICGDSFNKSLNKLGESFNGVPQYPEIDMTNRQFVKGTPVIKANCSGADSSSIQNNGDNR